MPDHHVTDLAGRLAAVEDEIQHGNALLAEILETLRNNNKPAPPAGARSGRIAHQVPVEATSRHSRNTAQIGSLPATGKSHAPDAAGAFAGKAEADPVPDLDDLRSAFLSARAVAGKDAAIAAVTALTGPLKNITHVPKENFAAVAAALAELARKEAA